MTNAAEFRSFAADLLAWIDEVEAGNNVADQFPTLAWRLFGLQSECVSTLRDLCRGRGIALDVLRDWRDIPVVPTRAFKEFPITSLSPDHRTAEFRSSQTTGRDFSRCFHDPESLAVYERSALTWFRVAQGLRPGDRRRVLVLTPPKAEAPHSSLVHMFELIRHEHGDEGSAFLAAVDPTSAWVVEPKTAWAALREASDGGTPVLLLGTAFSFVHLLDGRPAGQPPVRLPAGSFVLETGGYKGRSRELPKSDLHAALGKALGLAPQCVRTEYGMCELSSQAYDTFPGDPPAGQRRFRFPPWARAVVVSPETGREVADGESGLLRVYDLANVRSVLAIETEDLAVRRGLGFELLGRAARAEARGCSLMPAAT